MKKTKRSNSLFRLVRGGLVGLMSCIGLSGSAQIPIDVFSGSHFTAVDIQWLKPFSPTGHFLLYSWSRYTVDYHNQTSYFMSNIIAYGFKNGFGIATEVLAAPTGMTYKVGVQYLRASATELVYVWVNTGHSTRTEYALFALFRVQPRLTDRLKLFAQLELTNTLSNEGNVFSAQRPRLGIGRGTVQGGLAAEFSQVSSEWQSATNYGLFIRKEF